MGRDTKYTEDFRGYLGREGVKPVRCTARAPDCNAFAERIVRSIKDECLDRMILFGSTRQCHDLSVRGHLRICPEWVLSAYDSCRLLARTTTALGGSVLATCRAPDCTRDVNRRLTTTGRGVAYVKIPPRPEVYCSEPATTRRGQDIKGEVSE